MNNMKKVLLEYYLNIQKQKSDSTKNKWQKSDNFDPQFLKLALPLNEGK